ncbi:MAG: L-2-hydroxyglutarate oxidase [Acidimicrobiales bacterium]|nr:L-2-hydroxyglutarate oxidase [Acidimicrobiales bacterium]
MRAAVHPSDEVELAVVGAGIVGLATAVAALETGAVSSVAVLDKESTVAAHQSGHNSGVVHAGVYYPPGSAKARLCREGRLALQGFCRARGIPLEICGKVIVATSAEEAARLELLRERAVGNDLRVRTLNRRDLAELEPQAEGLVALHVPETGVVDYRSVCDALAGEITTGDGVVLLGREVRRVRPERGRVLLDTPAGTVAARRVVNCAGLHSDHVAMLAGHRPGARIVGFRGEYHELRADRRWLVRSLVYPVPDPRFPFLGVHLTRGIDGAVHAGPNAVLALGREHYGWRRPTRAELAELARTAGLVRLGLHHAGTEAAEVVRSLSRQRFAAALRRLVPAVRTRDLVPAGAGVRAQALRADGTLVDDFAIEVDGPVVHVLNAPSPAATASLAIGREIVRRLPD